MQASRVPMLPKEASTHLLLWIRNFAVQPDRITCTGIACSTDLMSTTLPAWLRESARHPESLVMTRAMIYCWSLTFTLRSETRAPKYLKGNCACWKPSLEQTECRNEGEAHFEKYIADLLQLIFKPGIENLEKMQFRARRLLSLARIAKMRSSAYSAWVNEKLWHLKGPYESHH